MHDLSIRVQRLGKQYRAGAAQERYRTLRDSIVQGIKGPITAIGNRLRGVSQSKEDDTFWALRDINFEAVQGEVIGFIGRNGAGKSTLLKVLSRITEPTTGRAELYGRVGSLLEVGTGFHPELTGRENVYLSGSILGMRKATIEEKFDEIVAFAEVERFIDTPVKHYSSGMYLRMAFAVAAHLDPELLFVDEVLAVGDAAFQKKCINKMMQVAKQGQTVLFVSHNLDAVLALCTRCIVLQKGQIVFDGSPQDAVMEYHRLLSPVVRQSDESVLYQEDIEESQPAEFPRVTRIEALDSLGKPKPLVSTWDDLMLRIYYDAPEDVTEGAFVIDIRDYKEQRLIVLDSGTNLPLRRGTHSVDCHISKLPLPSGEYYLTVGITNPYVDWLWRKFTVGVLRVFGKDVYEIGRPPAYSRMTIVADCQWRSVEKGTAIAAQFAAR